MHVCFLPQASIELCRSQNSGMEPARRHEDGLSSPYQNALCSAFTRKKGRLFPGTLARPRPATEVPQRKGKASLALRRASRALALRPLSVAGRTRDAWLREKGFWPSFSPKGGRERSVLASVQRTVPTQGRACLPRPMPAERLKKVSVFCLAK